MGIVSAIAIGLTVASAAGSAYQSKRAGDRAEAAEELALETEAANTAEAVRRMEEEQRRTQGLARARAGMSGAGGLSQEMYLTAMEESAALEVDWLRQVGVSRAESIQQQGEAAQATAEAGMWSDIASGATSAFQIGWGA